MRISSFPSVLSSYVIPPANLLNDLVDFSPSLEENIAWKERSCAHVGRQLQLPRNRRDNWLSTVTNEVGEGHIEWLKNLSRGDQAVWRTRVEVAAQTSKDLSMRCFSGTSFMVSPTPSAGRSTSANRTRLRGEFSLHLPSDPPFRVPLFM